MESESFHIHPSSPHIVPIQFDTITSLHQSSSHLDLHHKTISGISRFRLYLHDFHPAHWETLTTLLVERTRTQAPKARITTPLDPLGTHDH